MRVYIVQQGDTLWKIARQHNVDFEQLKQMNNHLANPDLLMPGMEILLPEEDCQKEHPPHTAPPMQPYPQMPPMQQMPHMHDHMMEPMYPCFICQMMPMPWPPMQQMPWPPNQQMPSMPWPHPQMMPQQMMPQQTMPQMSPLPQQPCAGAGCGGDSAIDQQYYDQIRALEQQAMPMQPYHPTPFW